jgi:hypothetical protein
VRQELTTDSVERHIKASPKALYDIVSDVTRTPELSPEVVKCTWIPPATGPVVGARFKAINSAGRGPNWPNKPVVVTAEPEREFAFARTELGAGTVEWRYRFVPEGDGTRVHESYLVTRPVQALGWFIIDTLYGLKNRQDDLRRGMIQTLERLARIAESASVE